MNSKHQIDKWEPPICDYDPSVPGDRERITAEIEAAARSAGWTEADGPCLFLVPINGITQAQKAKKEL
jgi:hypothetical protein